MTTNVTTTDFGTDDVDPYVEAEPVFQPSGLDELVDFITETANVPMSFWAVAALLESRGIRDIDAIERYYKRSVFDLAEAVFRECVKRLTPGDHRLEQPSKMTRLAIFRDFIRYYLKGTVFALPMAGQIAAILILRYSLWAWLDFTVMQASLVAIGTISSFVISGGLIQAIGREGTFYNGQANPILLEAICRRLVFAGLLATGTLSLAAIILNAIFPYFSLYELFIGLLYFCLLTPLWLMLAILYMMSDNVAILLSTLIGTGAVHIVMQYITSDIHTAHAIGIVVATACSIAWGQFRIKRKKKKAEKKHHLAKLPRPSILSFIIEPFVLYGTLYFSLLFVDRIIAWSVSDHRLPLIIWFRTAYELGMDWALLSLILTFAVLEYTVNQFNLIIIPVQEATHAKDFRAHNRRFMRFYIQQNLLLGLVGIFSIFITYILVIQLRRLDHIREIRDFFASPVTYFVYWNAAIAYLFLAFALLNALFFFSLARPSIVVKATAIGLVVDIVAGYILSRIISYEYAVCGLVLGCFVFGLVMLKKAIRMFRSLDYYYYSAF